MKLQCERIVWDEIIENSIGEGEDKIIENVINVSNQNKLIKDYCEKIYKGHKNKDDKLKEIIKINEKLNKNIIIEEKQYGIKWKIIKLKF